MHINFDKMEGAGNDFILIDNRNNIIPNNEKPQSAAKWCRRETGIGADGLIFIEKDPEFDFAWDFYNADGSHAEMCGNGARCAALYAKQIGAANEKMTFRSLAGPIEAELTNSGAKIRLPDAALPKEITGLDVEGQAVSLWLINTGVPHAVVEVSDLESVKVKALGRAIRYHKLFSPEGTNVDFFRPDLGDSISLRTYERGVENETLACGTGAVATSIVAGMYFGKSSPVTVRTRGESELTVHFRLAGNRATDVYLEGGARRVFSGTIDK